VGVSLRRMNGKSAFIQFRKNLHTVGTAALHQEGTFVKPC
jgi:hypothetical protein